MWTQNKCVSRMSKPSALCHWTNACQFNHVVLLDFRFWKFEVILCDFKKKGRENKEYRVEGNLFFLLWKIVTNLYQTVRENCVGPLKKLPLVGWIKTEILWNEDRCGPKLGVTVLVSKMFWRRMLDKDFFQYFIIVCSQKCDKNFEDKRLSEKNLWLC